MRTSVREGRKRHFLKNEKNRFESLKTSHEKTSHDIQMGFVAFDRYGKYNFFPIDRNTRKFAHARARARKAHTPAGKFFFLYIYTFFFLPNMFLHIP